MNAAHKILTVSYGTFSCTLEGFDDPFNTMKAIAEYFRDLAAEDRYFGAEPPQPDAAMLHKIAEREIQRRVEAKLQDNGVVLRARDALEAPEPAAEPLAPPVASASIGMTQTESAPVAPAAHQPAPQLLAEEAAQIAMASAAQRLQRLRAAQASHAPLPPAQPVTVAPAPAPAPMVVERVTEVLPPTAPELEPPVAAEVHEDDILARLAEIEATEVVQEAPANETPALQTEDLPAEDLASEDSPAEDLAENDDALLLSALRETLAGSLGSESEIGPEIGPEMAPAVVALTETAELDVAPQPEEPAEAAPLQVEPVATEIETAEIETAAALSLDDEASEVTLTDLTAPELTDLAPETFAQDANVADEPQTVITAMPSAEVLAQVQDETAEMAPELPASEETERAEREAIAAILAEPVAAPSESPQIAEKIQRARARVIKIRRLEPAPAAETVSDSAPQAEPTPPQADAASALRQALTEPAPSRLPAAQTDEASVNRLIQKANDEFEEPQTKRRRSAIAHLKAAVLATVAERRARGTPKPDENLRQNPYRQDLDQVMRPASEKPAPLVLVPALRIDQSPQPAPALQPVRPRRVTHATNLRPAFSPEEDELAAAEVSNVFDAGAQQSFQDFADGLGASSLQDLIEAAGAYLTLTKGQGGFTRPELFAQLTAAGSEPSREDGLRGFGRLLREGRLARTDAGTYALTEISPMLAQVKRRAG